MNWVAHRKVYFAQTAAAPDLVKIGCSAWPQDRIYQLRSCVGEEVIILAVAPGCLNTERALHKKFSRLREEPPFADRRGVGSTEWFRMDRALSAFIAKVAKTGKIPIGKNDLPEAIVMRMRRNGASFREIGEAIGISRQRANQIHSEVLLLKRVRATQVRP